MVPGRWPDLSPIRRAFRPVFRAPRGPAADRRTIHATSGLRNSQKVAIMQPNSC